MTPIPPDVAAAIVAAGHTVQVNAEGAWLWSRGELRELPSWRITVGDGYGRGATARAATLDALARLAASETEREGKCRAEAKRVRLPYRKAQETERAEAAAKRAADMRALAATVAAMWPEVTP